MDKRVSRRNFLMSSGAALTAGLGVAGISAAHAAESPAWDYEADLVVAGFGAAGSAAAVAAADAGMSVIVLEKEPEELAGGNLTVAWGSYGLPGRGGFQDADLLKAGALTVMSDEVCEAVAAKLEDGPRWLESIGVQFEWFDDNTSLRAVRDEGWTSSGNVVYRYLKAAVEERADSVSVHYETPVTDLIWDQGKVVGFVAEHGGKSLRFGARKGVIMATGDYGADPSMISCFGYPAVHIADLGCPFLTGDGHKMLLRAGAKFKNMNPALGIEWAGYSSGPYDDETGSGILMAPKGTSFLYVDMHGERFDDEARALTHDKRPLNIFWFDGSNVGHPADQCEYRHLPAFIVFDEKSRLAGPLCAPARSMGWSTAHDQYEWSQDNSVEIEKGWILKADTLEELAGQMKAADVYGRERQMDAAALLGTIEQYNENVTTLGYDPDFSRGGFTEDNAPAAGDPGQLLPLDEGPFYAMEIYPCLLYPTGGPVFDEHCRVLDYAGNPIPGLYCAGNISQTGLIKTTGSSGGIAQARVAVESIAAL